MSNTKSGFLMMFTQNRSGKLKQKEGNVLFNDALNTFYLQLYGERENVLFHDALNTFYLRLYGEINER